MSTPKSDIQSYLGLLSRHSEIIDQTYRSRTVRDDGSISGALSELQNARILIITGEGEYRLATGIKTLLDDYTQRQRTFAASQNIAGEIESLRESLMAYETSVFNGSSEDRDRLLDDIHYSIGAIHDTISQDLLRFQQATEVTYSNTADPKEKAQQNAYFLKQAKSLEETLRVLTSRSMHLLFEADALRDVRTLYRREVENSIGEWSDTLLRTIDILQKYLYRHRQITMATRRLRGLGQFLRKNSLQLVEDALEGGEADLEILRHVSEGTPPPYPDFISPEGQQNLLPTVQKMQHIEKKSLEPRRSGKRSRDGDMIEVPDILSPEEQALSFFLSSVDGADCWISARREIGTGKLTDIDLVDLLEEILNWSSSTEEPSYQVRPVHRGDTRKRSANAEIRDIEVCRAA